jgi:hypothetical protein
LLISLTVVFVAVLFFVAVKVTVVQSSVNATQQLAAQNVCARKIASQFEDRRDAIFTALDDRPLLLQRISEFREFKIGPGGHPESRAHRTTRLCPEVDG